MDEKFLDAIDHYREHFDIDEPLLADDYLICECHCVSALDIRLALGETKQVDLDFLKSHFGMGTGCGGCLKRKHEWLDKIF